MEIKSQKENNVIQKGLQTLLVTKIPIKPYDRIRSKQHIHSITLQLNKTKTHYVRFHAFYCIATTEFIISHSIYSPDESITSLDCNYGHNLHSSKFHIYYPRHKDYREKKFALYDS